MVCCINMFFHTSWYHDIIWFPQLKYHVYICDIDFWYHDTDPHNIQRHLVWSICCKAWRTSFWLLEALTAVNGGRLDAKDCEIPAPSRQEAARMGEWDPKKTVTSTVQLQDAPRYWIKINTEKHLYTGCLKILFIWVFSGFQQNMIECFVRCHQHPYVGSYSSIARTPVKIQNPGLESHLPSLACHQSRHIAHSCKKQTLRSGVH